jgi:hypothetical protein
VNAAPCLSILIWSEDHAPDAHETVFAVAKKMLTLVDPGCRTNRIEVNPLDTKAARALKGAGWKSTSRRDLPNIVSLRQTIASKLVEGTASVAGFVFFHIDGDTAWERRSGSEQPTKFAELAAAVEQLVAGHLASKGRSAETRAVMSRFRPLMPFHSIEAWLFQNTAELARVCAASCGRHVTLIQEWATRREELDELEGEQQPKNKVKCVRSDDRLALASKAYPAHAVYAINKSYTAAVDDLRACPDLCAALARTYAA